ncbi:hypothetical protein ACFL1X_00540 [Candidatus Hydrogenedentota bacterium]
MNLLNNRSLSQTLDVVNEALFMETAIPRAEKNRVTDWLAGRQGLRGSYAGMFAPTTLDYKEGVRVFTGERIKTRAGTAHVLGEEACRAMALLGGKTSKAMTAFSKAAEGMNKRLRESEKGGHPRGSYCCGTCTSAMWRSLAAGCFSDRASRLSKGMGYLKENRDGEGRWGRFPFYYTLLALSEIENRAATSELRYAAPTCERLLKRSPRDEKYDGRRRMLVERVLARV